VFLSMKSKSSTQSITHQVLRLRVCVIECMEGVHPAPNVGFEGTIRNDQIILRDAVVVAARKVFGSNALPSEGCCLAGFNRIELS